MQESPSVYDIDCIDLAGKPFPLRQFAGRPMLIVNTASLCGFSYQFDGLERTWQHNKDKGLVVIGVPSNDFGHQEPGSSPQIVSMCVTKFGISFPLLQKTPVSGSQAHPLFQLLAKEGGVLARPRWNFYKYIVGRSGHLKEWFCSFTRPERPRFDHALAKAISGNA